MDVHLDKFFLTRGAYSHQSFFFFCKYAHFYIFLLCLLHQTILLTSQSEHHKRTHIHIYDRSLYSSCTFFFMLIRSFFSVALVSFSPFSFAFVRVREHTYMHSQRMHKRVVEKKIVRGRQ